MIQAAAQAHHQRLYLLFTNPDELSRDAAAAGAAWQQISCVLISHWNATLNKPVANHGVDKRMLYLGEVTSQGMVTPAPSSPATAVGLLTSPGRPPVDQRVLHQPWKDLPSRVQHYRAPTPSTSRTRDWTSTGRRDQVLAPDSWAVVSAWLDPTQPEGLLLAFAARGPAAK